MKKNTNNDEIDLIDAALVVGKKKWTVIFITTLVVITTFLYQFENRDSVTQKVNSEIQPISVYDDASYKVYNTFINSSGGQLTASVEKKLTEYGGGDRRDVINKSLVDNFLINNLDRHILFDLFIERFQSKMIFTNALKKFNFIKEENYADTIEYEKELSSIFDSIEFKLPRGKKFPLIVEFEYGDSDEWIKFLNNYEKSLNSSIQKKLITLFNEYQNFNDEMYNYELQDIKNRIQFSKNEEDKIYLKSKLDILENSNFKDRIKKIFDKSPISSEDFFAAKINHNNTSIINQNISNTFILIMSALSGIMLGIFYVLFLNLVQKRVRKIS